MPSGDSPDGMAATLRIDQDVLFAKLLSAIPVGRLPTGAGESPALPIPKIRSEDGFIEGREERRKEYLLDGQISRAVFFYHGGFQFLILILAPGFGVAVQKSGTHA